VTGVSGLECLGFGRFFRLLLENLKEGLQGQRACKSQGGARYIAPACWTQCYCPTSILPCHNLPEIVSS
jgi:hypothetical protein